MQGKKIAKKPLVTADAEMEEVKSEQAPINKKSRSRTPTSNKRQPLHAPPTTTEASKKKNRAVQPKVTETEVAPMETSSTKKPTEIKKTKANSNKRNAVTQVNEIVSSVMELEPIQKSKGQKSSRSPKVQAFPTPAPVTPITQPKSARNRSKAHEPTPQAVEVAKKQTKSQAPSKVTKEQPVDVVMSDQVSTTLKKKQPLEESKTAKTTASSKKLEVMPALKHQATQKKKIAETLSNNSISFLTQFIDLTEVKAKGRKQTSVEKSPAPKTTGKKSRKVTDEGKLKPPHAIGAYLYFSNATVPRIKTETNCTHAEAVKRAGAEWN